MISPHEYIYELEKMDERDICGIGPFSLPNDSFNSICGWHDRMYRLKEEGTQTFSRLEVDQRMLRAMLIFAGDSTLRKVKAYTFYGLARLFGGPLWKWKL